jgi:nitroreductase
MTVSDDIVRLHRPKPKHKVIKEISARWSPRFYSDEKVPLEDLRSIFEAARWAPSAHNHQPWYYFYSHKGTASYQKLFSTLNEYNRSWAKTAPLLILACAIVKNQHGKNPYAYYDLGASVISLILQAQALGYHARQMGLFDKEKVTKYFSLKNDLEPYIVIALGKTGDYKKAPAEIIKREMDPRPRKTAFWAEL